MGLLVDGVWQDQWYDTHRTGGQFERKPTTFRGQVSRNADASFPAEHGRYHLYVSYACPWAHRTLIVRQLKGLTRAIPVWVVDPRMGAQGWVFGDFPGANTTEPALAARALHQLYTASDASYSGRVTVPVLWDSRDHRIVNNESSEIIRLFNGPMASLGSGAGVALDLYPKELRQEINRINDEVYPDINNGVYRAGFATTQQAYEEAVAHLFQALDRLEQRLDGQRYLAGDRLTEADIRLFTTLVRFDAVYHGHFKCNLRALTDYPNLWAHTRELYQLPGVAETVRLDHIKTHYYWSHASINPTRVVPMGPALDLMLAHGRERLPAAA